MNQGSRVLIAVLLVAAAVAGFFVWKRLASTPAPPPPAPLGPPIAPRLPPPPPPVPDAAVIQHPIERRAGPLPGADESDDFINKALIGLLGKKAVLSFLYREGFARRFVATVDNLALERAPVQLWPVNPMPGRFDVAPTGDVRPRNAERYAPFVRFAAGVDTRRAVALYRRLYPIFQQTYEELGYPGRYFNDRVVEVIDQLLATPDVPLKVRPIVSKATGKPTQYYSFEDPSVESRAAGQKILIRMGRENAAILKAKLREVRPLIARR